MKRWKFLLLFLLSVAMIATCCACSNKKIAFKVMVDDQMIEEKLYEALLHSKVADVTNYYYQEYGMDVDKDFWNKEVDGMTPLSMIKQQVNEQLIWMQANYQLGNKYGYESDGIATIVERMNSENELRNEKIEKGEIVYGLKEYTITIFANYDIEQLEEACVLKMNVTNEDAFAYYEQHPQTYMAEDQKIYDVLEIYYAIDETLIANYDIMKSELNDIHKAIKDGAKMADVIGKYAPYMSQIDTKTLDLDFDGDVLDIAYDFKENQVSDVIEQNGTFYIIDCLKVNEGTLLPFDEVDQDIVYQLKQEAYLAEVEMMKSQVVFEEQCDLDAWILQALN